MSKPNSEGFFEGIEKFVLLKTTDKITYEFSVNPDEKDLFSKWIKILSSVEFKVDVKLDDIRIEEYKDRVLFRIRVSGAKRDLKRWQDNLQCVAEFLKGEYEITHLKNFDEQK